MHFILLAKQTNVGVILSKHISYIRSIDTEFLIRDQSTISLIMEVIPVFYISNHTLPPLPIPLW